MLVPCDGRIGPRGEIFKLFTRFRVDEGHIIKVNAACPYRGYMANFSFWITAENGWFSFLIVMIILQRGASG